MSEQAEAEREAVDAKATEEQAEQKEEEAQPAAEEAQPDAAEKAEQEEERSDIIDAQVAAAEAQREKRSAEANDREEQEAKRQRYGRTIRQGHRHMEVPSQWINEIDLQDANSVSSSDPVVGNPLHVPNGDAHAYLRSGTHVRGYKGAHADSNERYEVHLDRSLDCSVTGFWRDALGAVPHMGEACVPLSVLSAYCCGSGWLPC